MSAEAKQHVARSGKAEEKAGSRAEGHRNEIYSNHLPH